MASDSESIERKLDNIQADLNYLKKHIVNVDAILTDDDLEALKDADEDLKKGRTKRL